MLGDQVRRLWDYAYFQSWNWGLWVPSDRKAMIEEILPFYARSPHFRNVLFVGVRRYTSSYPLLFSKKNFVTIDIDPLQKKYGSSRHICDDFFHLFNYEESHFKEGFDVVFLNGMIGFGLNDEARILSALKLIEKMLKPEGHLIVGASPTVLASETFLRPLQSCEALIPCQFAPWHSSAKRYRQKFSSNQHEYRFYFRKATSLAQAARREIPERTELSTARF